MIIFIVTPSPSVLLYRTISFRSSVLHISKAILDWLIQSVPCVSVFTLRDKEEQTTHQTTLRYSVKPSALR